MLELLSHVGSAEAVRAAVQSGADAVYLGFGDFHTRGRNSDCTEEDFAAAARYCRVRGCKLYFTLNTLVRDDELENAVALAVKAAKHGADAIVVQDIGMASILREVLPDMPLHGSVRMDIHSLAGVYAAAEMGLSRVMLAPELSRQEIRHIAASSPIELGIHASGGLCACHAGQCYMSALLNGSSDNRGLCAQPCLLDYSLGSRMDDHPLSLRDNCLVQQLSSIEELGIRCVLIEANDKRAEYVSMITRIYAQAMRDGKMPTAADLEQICEIFSQQGFSDAYFTGDLSKDMFGVHAQGEKGNGRLFSAVRRSYVNAEKRRVPVRMRALVHADKPVILTAKDELGNSVIVQGSIPVPAASEPALTASALHAQLYKTAGTPYLCTDVESDVQSGLSVSTTEINTLRNELLALLSEKRAKAPAQRVCRAPLRLMPASKPEVPELNIQISDLAQLSPELAVLEPTRLYIPLELFSDIKGELAPFVETGCAIVAVLPRVILSSEEATVSAMLAASARFGVKEALLGNLGQVLLARKAGLGIRGDFGLNLCNVFSLDVACRAGFLSATASFELSLEQIRSMSKSLPLEILAYGRLPLMITENCIIKNSYGSCACKNQINLTDRQGAGFPVFPAFGCRNQIFHAKKLFLADKPLLFRNSGVSAARLLFTTENARECVEVTKTYLGMSDYVPNGITRGAYFRGLK